MTRQKILCYISAVMDVDLMLRTCQKCKACCCKYGGADFTKKEMLNVLKAGFPDYFVKINDNHYEMKSHKKGICAYLKKDNSCMIHKFRPRVCKSFPIYVEYKNNKTKFFLMGCPLAKFLSKQDIKTMKNWAKGVKEIVTTTFSHSKLPKSDLEIIEKRFNKFKKLPLE